MDDIAKVQIGNLDFIDVCVKELEEVVCDRRLVRILHTNAELIGIGRGEVKRQRIVVAHRLNELEQINHVHAENVLCRAVIVLKAVVIQTQINEDRVSFIYRHHLDAAGVKLQIRLGKNLLECFYERAECSRLDSSDFKEVSVGVGLGGTHLMPGVVIALSNQPRLDFLVFLDLLVFLVEEEVLLYNPNACLSIRGRSNLAPQTPPYTEG